MVMLGARIAALRRNAGWSQAELAAKLQVSASAVGMYEQGRREPSAQILLSMAALFGVSTDYLLTGRMDSSAEAETVGQALLRTLADADNRLKKRDASPFTRQELTVLLAAMLMEA